MFALVFMEVLLKHNIHFVLIESEMQFKYIITLCRYQAELPVYSPEVIHGEVISSDYPTPII